MKYSFAEYSDKEYWEETRKVKEEFRQRYNKPEEKKIRSDLDDKSADEAFKKIKDILEG